MMFGSAAMLPESAVTDSTVISASAADEPLKYGPYTYKENDDGTVTITKYNSNYKKLSIPAYINGKAVATIGYECFRGDRYLEEVTIPNTVKVIAGEAFFACQFLKKVSLPNGLEKIYYEAFRSCGVLESICIPESVTMIGNGAFMYCGNLAELNIPKGADLGIDAFSRTKWIEQMEKKSPMVVVDGRLIYAKNCSGNVVIPNTVTNIVGAAFKDNKRISSVQIPTSVTQIDANAFDGCTSLTNVTIPGSVMKVGTCAFRNCTNLKNAAIKNGVGYISGHAFDGCSKLEKIVIPSSMTSVEWECFRDCTSLKEVTLPNSLTRIDNMAFTGCSSLKSIKIPYGVTKLGSSSFYGCTGLTSVSLPSTLQYIGQHAFSGCQNLKTITIPKSVTGVDYWSIGYYYDTQDNKMKKIDGVKIRCIRGSAAQKYAKDHSIAYELYTESRRIAGNNRFETAALISKNSCKTSDTVVLASGMDYADALAGVPLAAAVNAPILLTEKKELPKETLTEIKRLGAKKVYILGGKSAVSASVESTLRSSGLEIERLWGQSRFETAVRIAEKLSEISGKAPSQVFFTYYNGFADALSVSSAAAIKGAPVIYLSTKGTIDETTKKYLTSIKGSVKKAYVIGGTSVISDSMMSKASSALGLTTGKTANRIWGKDRYATCIAVNKTFASTLNGDTICIATGLTFPDALAGGVYAALKKAPLFLADNSLSKAQQNYLDPKTPDHLTVFGGVKAVPSKLVNSISALTA